MLIKVDGLYSSCLFLHLETFYVPVTCFLLFTICDYAGKILSGYVEKVKRGGYGVLLIMHDGYFHFISC